jgi:uncharacterized metal-binding protein
LSVHAHAGQDVVAFGDERNNDQQQHQRASRHKSYAITPKTMTTMKSNTQCSCQSAPKLIFPCSGASDVGGLADRAARQMTLDQTGKMYCLAGIGGRVKGILETTRAAAKILAIDGCPQECARKTLEQAGFTGFQHLTLASMGLQKGSSPVTDDRIRLVANKGAELLA